MKFILSLFFFFTIASCKGSPRNIIITPENSVTLRTTITDASVDVVISSLAKLDRVLDEDEPIYLILNTPGGSVLAGNVLIEYIKGLKREVKTISLMAASMGFIIQQSAGERLVLASSILMSHPASTSCEGNIYQLQTCLSIIKDLAKRLDEVSSERMKMKLDDYIELIEHDKWFIGTDMLFYNVADRLITLTCSNSLMKEVIIVTTDMGFFGTVKEKFSACPFLKEPLK